MFESWTDQGYSFRTHDTADEVAARLLEVAGDSRHRLFMWRRADPDAGYRSQDARDAEAYGIGDRSYWDYLERLSHEHHAYFTARGDHETAARMFTRSLSEALAGNNGD